MGLDEADMKRDFINFPRQCVEALDIVGDKKIQGSFDSIVICGMGGSAIGGDILSAHMEGSKIPVTVLKDYTLPGFVNEKTLVLCVSYSGNTEEPLNAMEEAKAVGATIVGFTSGGKLEKINDLLIKIPSGLQPRNSSGYQFFSILKLLSNSDIVEFDQKDFDSMIEMLEDSFYFEEKARKIAKNIGNKLPIIYTTSKLFGAANRFKCDLNENSNMPAYVNLYPEMCHNEILGFDGMDREKYIILQLRNSLDHSRNKKRMDICEEIMRKHVNIINIEVKGDSIISKNFYAIYLGNWISYWLALNRGVDPSEIEVIENLKKALNKRDV